MNNIEIVKNIKKAVNGDLEATFNLIMQYEGLINKYSRIDGSINLECRDYIVDKLRIPRYILIEFIFIFVRFEFMVFSLSFFN